MIPTAKNRWWALALLWCAHTSTAAARAPRPRAAVPWMTALQGQGDVAVLCGPKGVSALTGTTEVTLTHQRADWCAVDPRGQVVWFGDARRAAVLGLDLQTPGAPVEVVTGALDRFVVGWSRPAQVMPHGFHNETHWMALTVDTGALRVVEGNMAYTLDAGALEADGRRAKVVGGPLLRRIAQRPPLKIPSSPCREGTPVPGMKPALTDCDDPAICGKVAGGIGATPLCSVLIRHSCGDGCYNEYAVWDSRADRFVDLQGLFTRYDRGADAIRAPGRAGDPLQVSVGPSGARLLAGGAVYDRRGGLLHPGLGAGPGGFLPAAPTDGAADYQAGMAALAACSDGEHLRTACAQPAFAQLRRAAEAGHRDAQFVLGGRRFSAMFQRRAPDPSSASDRAAYVDALTWLARAARAGHPEARQYLPPELMAALISGKMPATFEPPFGSFPRAWLTAAAEAARLAP